MDVKWKKKKKKVIDLRDRDILVSAAAGSGKTAVLVERIVNRIWVDNPPVDIDRMLVHAVPIRDKAPYLPEG